MAMRTQGNWEILQIGRTGQIKGQSILLCALRQVEGLTALPYSFFQASASQLSHLFFTAADQQTHMKTLALVMSKKCASRAISMLQKYTVCVNSKQHDA